MTIFDDAHAYRSFLKTVEEAQDRTSIRLLAYCVMPNHFHMVVWPERDGQLVDFMHWLQMTHSKRWHRFRPTEGTGALYQGRFKAFPIQTDDHFLAVCRYVERNPLRARLVTSAECWPWSSLSQRCKNSDGPRLEPWPILQPPDWTDLVNSRDTPSELAAVRLSMRRNAAYGESAWVESVTARRLCSRSVRGRPPSRGPVRGKPASEATQPDLRFA